MPFEIEFLPVSQGGKSGDAIVGRYHDGAAWRVMVIDAGYEETGDLVCEHIRRWYDTSIVDYVVSTHPDNDHMSGLRVVLREMDVRQLWLHAPFLHAEAILPLFRSRRWQVENLRTALRLAYPFVEELIEMAGAQGAEVKIPFQGARIGALTVLSPSRNMYEGLLPQFRDTPPPDRELLDMLGHWIRGVGRRTAQAIRYVVEEDWWTETLREGGTTAAENESSVVLYGNLGAGGILLTGDAGLRALEAAADYVDAIGVPLGDQLWLFQVPHHGSRNNLSPSMLNQLVGPPVQPGQRHPAMCIISAGAEDRTHPRQVVVNALARRGLSPAVTRKGTIRYQSGLRRRDGWMSVTPLEFSTRVEAYD